MNQHCLNCNETNAAKFCPNCGQASSTHRYSIKHFFAHDFIHGFFHLDKGFIFTSKELFTRPGHSIREYIQGKRIAHFNFFSYIIILITANHFLTNYANIDISALLARTEQSKVAISNFDKLVNEYPKISALAQIPLLALFSFLIFGKSNQNYTEHLVLNIYKAGGEFLIMIVFSIISVFYKNLVVLQFLFSFIIILSLLYSIWFYYQYFSVFGYSKKKLILLSTFCTISIILVISAISFFTMFKG